MTSSSLANSLIIQLPHPFGDVAARVQDAPDIDVVGRLPVENQIRVASEGPRAQVGDAQGVTVAWGACGSVLANVPICLLQGVDEAQGCVGGVLAQIVVDRCLDVRAGLGTRNDGFGLHALVPDAGPVRTRCRSASKYAGSATGPGADAAP